MQNISYLVLENGKIFKGKSFGYSSDVIAEIVFTTGMTGYLETLTDKSYFGQMVVQTFPLIGNYGVIPSDFESEQISASAYIVKSWCQQPSNFRSEGNIDTFLMHKKIVGLCDIDTRTLTKIIRENGVMNGTITKTPNEVSLEELKNYKIKDAVKNVSTKEIYEVKSNNSKYKVVLLDFGLKNNIIRELVNRDCDVVVMPYNATVEEILYQKPNGIMLSNGPGDPSENIKTIETVKKLILSKIPCFGICLGHQILALANDFSTAKLKYGHRGANQPVKDTTTNKIYITSQNHGFAVVTGSIDSKIASELFVNINDLTCEGIEYKKFPAFSVQFHPEACSGPQDTAFLFDRFIKLIGGFSYAVQ